MSDGSTSCPMPTALPRGLLRREDGSVVCPNVSSPMSAVVAHRDIDCIERFFASGFPLHLAIHKVNEAEPKRRDYTDLHVHPQGEINVIIPDAQGLEYEIQLGDEVFRVSEGASIWIPPNVPHSANVIRGSGYFVAVRLKEETGQ